MMNLKLVAPRTVVTPPLIPNGYVPSVVKTHISNKSNTIKGCKFGEKCHFAHGECRGLLQLKCSANPHNGFFTIMKGGNKKKKEK